MNVFRCHQLTAAVKEGDHVGVRDRGKSSDSRFEIVGNLRSLSRVRHCLGLAELNAVATIGKKDKRLLSSNVIINALFNHAAESVAEFFVAHIPPLSDVLLLHSEALEALDKLFTVVAEVFKVLEVLKVVKSAERRVVLI